MPRQLILSCEHASAAIPDDYQYLFEAHQDLLQTHEAYDIGAAEIITGLLTYLDVPYSIGEYSRLLIDLNRTLTHPHCFSRITKSLPASNREMIKNQYYLPYLQSLQGLIDSSLQTKTSVLHIAIHSFTPVLNQEKRQADIGLLYDPSRQAEKIFAESFKQALRNSPYRVRKNYPYRGTANGLPTYFRKHYSAKDYLGMELEINQKLLTCVELKQVFKVILNAIKTTT